MQSLIRRDLLGRADLAKINRIMLRIIDCKIAPEITRTNLRFAVCPLVNQQYSAALPVKSSRRKSATHYFAHHPNRRQTFAIPLSPRYVLRLVVLWR
ncbi:hypothetical protein D3C71_1772260 [compost metagenome]